MEAQVNLRSEDPTRMEVSTRQQKEVLEMSLNIFIARSRNRGDLWAEFGPEDSEHHMKSKLARVGVMLPKLKAETLKGPGSPYEDIKGEVLDDLYDLINYAAFTVRHITGEKP